MLRGRKSVHDAGYLRPKPTGGAVNVLDPIRQHPCALYSLEMSIRSSVVQGSTASAASRSASKAYSRSAGRRIRSTTVLYVRRNSSVVCADDRQATLGESGV